MDKINIQFTLFSAFYAPLISTISGDFLKAEGLDPRWSVAPPADSQVFLYRRLGAALFSRTRRPACP